MRQRTDRIMSTAWILIPLIGIVAAFAGILASFTFHTRGIAITIPLYLLGGILEIFFWYFLISRRNNHFARDVSVRQGLIEYLGQSFGAMGRSNEISTELATMNAIHGEANAEEREKSAVLWIILSIITLGIAGLYVLYFLTKDPYKHDRRQQSFMQQVQQGFSKLGKTVVNPSWNALPNRSYIVYLIVDIITLGLFGFYWYYVLIKDMNEHFKTQWQVEDNLLAVM
jgi:Domain of unknown function (DUF4234)